MHEPDRQIQDLRRQLAETRAQLERANRQADLLRSQQATLRLELESQARELNTIHASRPYSIGLKVWDLRKRLAPNGSLRERLAGAIFDLFSRRKQPSAAPAPISLALPSPAMKTNPALVRIVAERFLDERGNNMFLGGAERYVIELVRLIHELGYRAEVVQAGREAWVRAYGDILVRGLVCQQGSCRMSKVFHQSGLSPAALTIYHPFLLAEEGAHRPAIGISHGIFWDQAGYQESSAKRDDTINAIMNSVGRLDQLISVDTNTINWLRTMDVKLAERVRYLPNFVDLNEFQPAPESQPREQITILYPRRLYAPRGFWLVRAVIDDVLDRHRNVQFRFIGQADLAEDAEIQRLIERHGERIRWECLPPEAMPEAYREADITLIPTVNSEGTSLSCLEAQASGNAVIATNVGGLPDLIIHEHNGLLIEPRADQLATAIDRLIEDPGLRRRLGLNARDTARTFDLVRWRNAWRTGLNSLLLRRPKPRRARPVILFPAAAGENWENAPDRRRRLATQLSLFGWEVFWVNDGAASEDPNNRLHILDREDDFYAYSPIVFVDHLTRPETLGRFPSVLLIFDAADASDLENAASRGLAARSDVVLVSGKAAAQRLAAVGVQNTLEVNTDATPIDRRSRSLLPLVRRLLRALPDHPLLNKHI